MDVVLMDEKLNRKRSVTREDNNIYIHKLNRSLCVSDFIRMIVSAHNFRKKRAFFVKGATVAKKCINKSRTIRKKVVRLFTFGVDLKAHDSAF